MALTQKDMVAGPDAVIVRPGGCGTVVIMVMVVTVMMVMAVQSVIVRHAAILAPTVCKSDCAQ